MLTNIVLVGMPGAGKSSVGRLLAESLNFDIVDTDSLIEKSLGRSIVDIFEKEGEAFFREIETSVIKSLQNSKRKVISVGGGAYQTEENRRLLNEIGDVYYLYTSVDVIYARISSQTQRPLLNTENPKTKLLELYNARHPFFKKAKYTIDTSNLNQYNVVDEILRIKNGKTSRG